MELNLRGKQVCITGGSAGIGLAVGRKFAEEGAETALLARDESLVKSEAERIENEFGVRSVGIRCDVTKPEEIDEAVKQIEEIFGGTDILVNNAGTGSEETVMEAEDERWYYYLDLHLMSAVRMSRKCVPYMRKRGGGVILHTSSICAKQPLWYEPIYNTTKAALQMFSKCLSLELIKDNIRVNTVSPGLVLTRDWWKTAGILSQQEGIEAKEYLDRIAREHAPIGRFAEPEEIAELYVFLASEKGSYVVGSDYLIDGGWLKTVD